MAGVAHSELRRREGAVMSACLGLLQSQPLGAITLTAVAEASGLPEWAAYRAVGRLARDRDHLIRRAVLELCARIADRIADGVAPAGGVYATIEGAASAMAAAIKEPDFLNLYGLVVREGRFQPWLRKTYEDKVAGLFCARLAEAVRAAGGEAGAAVFFRPGAARRLLARLEWAVALPQVVPHEKPEVEDEAALIRLVAREAMAETHAWDLGAAA